MDRFAVLLDLWTNEAAYLENKRQVHITRLWQTNCVLLNSNARNGNSQNSNSAYSKLCPESTMNRGSLYILSSRLKQEYVSNLTPTWIRTHDKVNSIYWRWCKPFESKCLFGCFLKAKDLFVVVLAWRTSDCLNWTVFFYLFPKLLDCYLEAYHHVFDLKEKKRLAQVSGEPRPWMVVTYPEKDIRSIKK